MKRIPFLLLLGGLCACAGTSGLPEGPTPEPQALYARLRELPRPHTLQAEARVSYFGPEGRVRLRATVVVQEPNRFRLETLSPFEEPIDLMMSDGETLWWLSQGVLREGAATPERIGQLLPLPLTPEALVDMMRGGLPADAQPVAAEKSRDPRGYRLDLRRPGPQEAGWHRVWAAADANHILRWELADGPSAPARVSAQFFDWQEVEGMPLPGRIHGVTAGDEGADLRIRLEDVAVNQVLPEAVFVFDAGPDVPRAPW